jgi:hypothetical protein
MKLKLIHRNNPTGEGMVNYFKQSWSNVDCYKFEMNGHNYYEISAELGNDEMALVLNGIKALMNSLNHESIEDILALNGIFFIFPGTQPINRTYEVLLLNMSVISICQVVYTKSSVNQKYINEKQVPKVAELAKKTLNLLGLDYAMVKISTNGQSKLVVSDINASPTIRDKDLFGLLQIFDEIRNEYKEGQRQKPEVKLGADPEFMIANSITHQMIPASDFFPREGTVGCDNIRVPSRQQRPIAELRPKPDVSPLVLHANLKMALEQANKLIPYRNIKWLAGSQPFVSYAIGGHIHFSNLELNGHIIRALDNYLGLPIFLIENQQTAVKRRVKYGRLNDFRIKDYGGFEYRTPGSWLVSSEISLAVLCLAKLVSSNYVHLHQNLFVSVDAHRAFYHGDTQYFRPLFEDIWQDIQKLDSYKNFSQELEIIPRMIRQNQSWDENIDLRKSWHLSKIYNKRYTPGKTTIKASVSNTSRNRNQTISNRRVSNSARSASRHFPTTSPTSYNEHYVN